MTRPFIPEPPMPPAAATFHALLRTLHIGAGAVTLVLFWIPLAARKGSLVHRAAGWGFMTAAAFSTATALVSCLWLVADPVGFAGGAAAASPADRWWLRFFGALLGALACYTIPPLVLAVVVVRSRARPEALTTLAIRALALVPAAAGSGLVLFAAAWVGAAGPSLEALAAAAVGTLGLKATRDLRRFLARPALSPLEWRVRHVEFTLTCGIAFHTAFSVFGLSRIFPGVFAGPWQVVAWLLPAAVGLPVMAVWMRRERSAGPRPGERRLVPPRPPAAGAAAPVPGDATDGD